MVFLSTSRRTRIVPRLDNDQFLLNIVKYHIHEIVQSTLYSITATASLNKQRIGTNRAPIFSYTPYGSRICYLIPLPVYMNKV
jgi:hypothetical protein